MKRKIRSRRLAIAAVLALLMVITMTGCGNRTGNNTTDISNTDGTDTSMESSGMESDPVDTGKTDSQGIDESSKDIPDDAPPEGVKGHHVALETHRKYLYDFNEEKGAVVTSNFDLFYVSDEMKEEYPELANSLEKYSEERKISYTQDFQELKSSAAQLAEERGASLEDTLQCTVKMESKAVRSDGNVVSFYDSYEDYRGGAHGNYSYSGSNFDTTTGAKLTINDVVADKDAFVKYLKEELKSQYPDIEFSGLDNYFDRADAVDNIPFLCRYDGVEFYFEPDELVPYAAGAQKILVSADHKDILNEEYLDYPKTYISAMETDTIYNLDLNGDGILEEIGVYSFAPDDESGAINYTVKVGDKAFNEDAYAYDISPYLVKTENGIYIYVEERHDNDYRITAVYDINGADNPAKVTEFQGGHASVYRDDNTVTYEWTDPEVFMMATRMDVLGTYEGTKNYYVSDTGAPGTTQENYEVPGQIYLTALKELTLTEVDNRFSEEGEATVTSGTKLLLYMTDGENTAYLMYEKTGKVYKVITDKTDWPYTINDIAEDECFDGIQYAG